MLEQFELIGKTVARGWQKAGGQMDDFAAIATNVLRESRILETTQPDEIVDWLMGSPASPPQSLYDFGQPPVHVYTEDHFTIQVLFWIDSTTSIHQHSFSGAFGVLAGSSVQSTYRFNEIQRFSDRVIAGGIEFQNSEILERGDIRTIHPGDQFIHALFHLDRPSVSVVIRTHGENDLKPVQYNYLKPYLAIDPFYKPELSSTQIRMLESLVKTDVRAFWKAAHQLATNCEALTLYNLLCVAHRRSDDLNDWEMLRKRIPSSHQALVEYAMPCLKQQAQEMRVIELRKTVHDPVHRFFLALLLNVPNKTEIYRLISTRYPWADPESLVLRWLREIFGETRSGIKLNPTTLVILQQALRNPEFESSRLVLMDRLRILPGSTQENELLQVWKKLLMVDFLAPLFNTAHSIHAPREAISQRDLVQQLGARLERPDNENRMLPDVWSRSDRSVALGAK